MPIRVLHLSSGNLYGGVERILTALAEFRGLCPAMIPFFGLSFDGRQADELRAAGCSPHLLGNVRLSRPVSVLRARRALERLIEAVSPDVVVCHNPWPLVVFGPTVRRRKLPVVVWVHGALGGRNWLERWASHVTPAMVIANSHFTRSTIGTVFPGVASAVVYPPGRFRPRVPEVRAAVRGGMGVAPSTVVIIQVSRIEAGKGHREHLQALAALREAPPWEAWFAGGAQQTHEQRLLSELQQLAAKLGLADRVRFLGERRDVDDLLSAADIFCQPNSAPDAFGLAFVEAFAAGLPVVTTRVGGAKEVVDDSSGVLVAERSHDELVAALRRLVADAGHRGRLGSAAQVRAKHLCDPQQRLTDLHAALANVSVRTRATGEAA